VESDRPDLFVARERLMELVGQMLQRTRDAGQLRPGAESGGPMVAVSRLARPLPGTDIDEFGARRSAPVSRRNQ
jgi:hypothetical protein